ncbi:MAG: hypothetical protein LBU87_01420 [Lactobacillales bacterium]|jgi:DNA polymerase|nr:hypothetical protein [Lactobacillales bacterium]
MQVSHLHAAFDRLQRKYGSPELESIYGAGCIHKPRVCFVFMNPTGRNVASKKDWAGIKAPWVGTKNAWKLFERVGVLSAATLAEIQQKKPAEWDANFARRVYVEIAQNGAYVTNLGKCTLAGASPVGNPVFREYLMLLEEEIDAVRPEIIITFGNQVSSLFLNEPIKVSTVRKTVKEKKIKNTVYKVFPVYYPVGQGMRNIALAIEDIVYALQSQKGKK